MIKTEAQLVRNKLICAAQELLDGTAPGPLTGVRLAELAGVKRHRLTHDNPDINASFQERARALNRNKPEVQRLRQRLETEITRNKRLVRERDALSEQVKAYATALLIITEQRDELRSQSAPSNVTPLPPRAR